MSAGGPIGARGTGVGRLRDRVTLRSPTRTDGATGQARVTAWADAATVWARVEELGGAERFGHDQQYPEHTHRVTLRGGVDVRHDWQVAWGTKTLNVVWASGTGSGVGNGLVLLCLEQPPSTG